MQKIIDRFEKFNQKIKDLTGMGDLTKEIYYLPDPKDEKLHRITKEEAFDIIKNMPERQFGAILYELEMHIAIRKLELHGLVHFESSDPKVTKKELEGLERTYNRLKSSS